MCQRLLTPLLLNEDSLMEGDSPSGIIDSSFGVQRALVVGDSLVIAQVGGDSLWESTLDEYLKNNSSPYLKVVSTMVNNDLVILVSTRPLKSWKETLDLICTVPSYKSMSQMVRGLFH